MSRVVVFERTGGPEVLTVRTTGLPVPGPGELRLRVAAIGLNRAEVLFRSGVYLEEPKLPAGLGYEAAGTVEAVGADVTGFAVGDEVDVIPAFSQNDYPMYGTHVLAPARAVVHRSAGLTPVQGAAVWMPYLTAYGALAENGYVRPGDHVLLTAAASSVGLAAIRTVRRLGAVAIAATRTRAKKDRLLAAGAAEVIVTGEEDLLARVDGVTGGRGVRTVFDPVAGPGVETLARAIAPGGALIVYGRLDPRDTPLPGQDTFAPVTSRFYSMHEVTRDAERLRRGVAFVAAGLADGSFVPAVDRVFEGLDSVVEAHRYLEAGAQSGKIVITVTD
ncbi:zinc-dependent alcohol dehydrogenase family protein [Kitasatospora aureofaciens]|uniref:zinc-dependent alcohol dehydrogenase family protein n=1 Tax=Kitasatospora aureofaciens TaxID=1894 RepID=UPI001C46F4D7|nr:zinc-dependent alcohol dehydrogenase family protein [Kitasatospora aureofaciens]MBV6702219.1 zinc-dependent alcohol dehydrogenase family protein [Kitasatospora aureofaciens]